MDKYKIGNVTDNEKYAASNKVYYVILDSTEFFFFFFLNATVRQHVIDKNKVHSSDDKQNSKAVTSTLGLCHIQDKERYTDTHYD